PAPFDYRSPDTLAEAMALLASHAGEAKLLAGGQSLMPVLNFRLATPSLLVDLGRVPDLDGIAIGEDGVRIGAMVRWRAIERDPRLAAAHPLLKEAVSHVAHYQIRNRGTAGGSLAHADPAAELPGIAVACDGEIAIVGPKGARTVKAADFFIGPLATVLAEDEIITALALPPWPKERRWAFLEFARRRGDFAMAGIALFYDRDGGHARNAHVGVIGAASRPHRLGKAEARINGSTLDDAAILAAARAAAAEVDPPEDFHASAAYRRNLVEVLTERALRRAGA
ncbi:MAG TPA: xanthine dehydrogenase family protein subunit M, partial [Stellaceae bacterium]|nr:xanthine dehydrogenase family protein subunit M [Stellaceae bacterium]